MIKTLQKLVPMIVGAIAVVASSFESSAENVITEDCYSMLSNMNIPLVVVNTVNAEEPTCDVVSHPEGAWGLGIANATKVEASMKIIKNGEILYESGDYVKKESGLTIKIRGNTSGNQPKKSYKLKLQKKADLLFRDDKKLKDKDWVLLRTGSFLNTPIGFWTSELIGQEWTPGHEYVNLILNDTYRGLYVLCEQITMNPDSRIEVDEKDGYIVESDAYWWTEDIYFDSSLTHSALKFTYKYPDPEDITQEWHEAVSSDVLAHEQKIKDDTYDEAYDCESFAKWLLAWEILGTNDSGGVNKYLVKKDAQSKIGMGPIWDFDQALVLTEGWIGLHNKFFYFHHMLKSSNDSFKKAFTTLWNEKGMDVVESLIQRINAFAESPEGADYSRSLDLETEMEIPGDSWQPYIGDLETMRQYAVTFLENRALWLSEQFEDGTNGVENIGMDSTSSSGEIAYDMLGRKIAKNTPGIQIRNGKKVYIKP